MRRVQSARRGLFASTIPCLGSLLLVAASMGVVAPPASELERASQERDLEARRAQRAGDVAKASAHFAALGLAERAAEARRLADSLVPTEVEPIDLHSALYFVALAEGVVLDDVVQGELTDPGLAVLDDWIGLREVALRGAASIESVGAFVDGLCELGFPVVVLDVSLVRTGDERTGDVREGNDGSEVGSPSATERETAATATFAFELTLGALERAPLWTRPADDDSTDTWDGESSDEGGR